MISSISNFKTQLNTRNSVKKSGDKKFKETKKNEFKTYLSDYVPKLKGDEGIAKKYNYKEMTIFEKQTFDIYMEYELPFGVSYEEFKESLMGFPPVDAPKPVVDAYINTISKYPKNQRERIMAEFNYLESPKGNSDMETIIKNAVEHCNLVEIITGQSQNYKRTLYQDFLNEFRKLTNENSSNKNQI